MIRSVTTFSEEFQLAFAVLGNDGYQNFFGRSDIDYVSISTSTTGSILEGCIFYEDRYWIGLWDDNTIGYPYFKKPLPEYTTRELFKNRSAYFFFHHAQWDVKLDDS